MYKAYYKKHTLQFKTPAGTSRGVLTEKDAFYIFLCKKNNPECIGVGECSTLKELSTDACPHYEEMLSKVCADIDTYITNRNEELREWPSIRFGLETALKDIENGGKKILFPSLFTQGKAGIPINGLIWMGDIDFMRNQIKEKLDAGFSCIKIKVGNKNFEDELNLLKEIRKSFSENTLEIRLDANGAFSTDTALFKLEQLAKRFIHSIEQPIKQGHWTDMEILCRESPIPIALDEELINVNDVSDKKMLLSYIRPQYIIVKPSLLGGYAASEEWITAADKNNVGWWITSALESNIGLNAIAQWTYTLTNKMPQGLGTGQLYANNIPSPLRIESTKLWYSNNHWDLSVLA